MPLRCVCSIPVQHGAGAQKPAHVFKLSPASERARLSTLCAPGGDLHVHDQQGHSCRHAPMQDVWGKLMLPEATLPLASVASEPLPTPARGQQEHRRSQHEV